ncbi:MAG: C40 family peptidase [Candidatus Eisenbacteria bacterium]|nr:C40 family peptidase [Candidatus Eisenbacteria bacterium]
MDHPRALELAEREIGRARGSLDLRFDLWEVRAAARGDGIALEGRTTSSKALDLLREALGASAVPARDGIRLLPREGTAAWVVSAPVAGLHDRPDFHSPLVTQAILGERLTLLDDDGADWLPVRVEDGYVGFAHRGTLAEARQDRRTDREPSPLIRIETRRALIHAVPSETSLPVREAVFGSILLSRARRGGWTGVELPDGAVGWVRNEECAPTDGSKGKPAPRRIVETARIFLGVPYLWGGTSTFGIDCSGLVQRVFGAWGIRLPRDADLQCRVAAPLREGARRREGDLLFFGGDRVTHVAVSLGGAQLIHASGWVRVQSLRPDSPSYRKDLRESYRGAGRIPGLDA